MPKFSRLLASFLLICVAEMAHADQSLIDIYRLALIHDSPLSSALHGNEATQEKLEQGKALYRPTVSISGSSNHLEGTARYISAPASFGPGGRLSYDSYNYGLNVNQPIFRMQNIVQYQQSKIQVSQADKQLILAQQDLMMRTAQAYFDVLLAQDKIDLISSQKSAITGQLSLAKMNFKVGVATITDQNEAQAKLDLLVAQEISAINDFTIKQQALETIIGEEPKSLTMVRQDFRTSLPEPADMKRWVEIAEQNSVALSIQQETLELATKEVDLQSAGHYPTLDAIANYSDARAGGSINGVGSDSETTTVGVQMQIPLYQGGTVSSKVREAVANKLKAQDDVETARRKADMDTKEAYLTLMSNIAQVNAYEQALSSSQSQLDSTNMGYKVGLRNTVEVLNAQQQLYSAKRDLLQARYSYLLSQLKLKSTSGLLNELDMEETNKFLLSVH